METKLHAWTKSRLNHDVDAKSFSHRDLVETKSMHAIYSPLNTTLAGLSNHLTWT